MVGESGDAYARVIIYPIDTRPTIFAEVSAAFIDVW